MHHDNVNICCFVLRIIAKSKLQVMEVILSFKILEHKTLEFGIFVQNQSNIILTTFI